jgi:hypothetical protein
MDIRNAPTVLDGKLRDENHLKDLTCVRAILKIYAWIVF